MKAVKDQTDSKKALRKFFLLTFSLSWVAWIPLALSGLEVSLNGTTVGLLAVFLAGAFSPSIIGIWMIYQTENRDGRRDFWRRTVDFRMIRPGWIAFVLLVFPAVMSLTFLLEHILGGNPPSMDGVLDLITNPFGLIFFMISMLIGGPLAEELGWRGFALDKLLEGNSPIQASFLLGVIHAVWHIPLFFIQGTSQGMMGIGTVMFWLWAIQVVGGDFFFTWVYLHSQRSILSAILIHLMSNVTFTIVAQLGNALPVRTEIIRTVVIIITAVVLVSLSDRGKERLSIKTLT